MGKISKDDIKLLLGTVETKYDNVIDSMIGFAYGYLNKFIGFVPETEKFQEYQPIVFNSNNELPILASGSAKDIELTSAQIDGNALEIENDLQKIGFSQWKIINTAYTSIDSKIYYIEYKSPNLSAQVHKVLTEIIIFEINKMPDFNNSISKRSTSLEGQISEQFISDEVFYQRVDKQLSDLFLKSI
jgi:hypothetical protein